MSAAQTTASTVTYTLAGTGGATLGTDTGINTPAGNTGTLTFAAGEVTKTVVVPITLDSISPEAGEGVSITLSTPSTGTLLSTTAAAVTVAITDVPVTYTLTSNATSVFEGAPITYTLTASAASTTATTINFSVVPGDAAAANQGTSNTNLNDFAAGAFNPAAVVLAAGATTANYVVTSATDTITELPENYSVKAVIGTTTVATATTSLLDGTGVNVGTTFTLTAGSDTGAAFTGGASDDTFISNVVQNGTGTLTDTLQSVDQLNGGAGTDTLNVTTTGSVATITPSLTSIEVINLRATTAPVELALSASTGVTAVNVNNSSSVATVSSLGAASFGVANQTQNASIKGSTATALGLNFDTVGTKTTSIIVDIAAGVANAATSFVVTAKDAYVILSETTTSVATTSASIAATGANKIAFAVADLASLTSLTVTGAGSVDVSSGALSALKTLTAGDGGVTVTGTDSTAINLTAVTGAGADTLVFNGANVKSITTGAGNDAVTLNTAALAATATVSLGDGNDTITLSGGAPTAGATIDGGVGGTDTFAIAAAGYVTVAGYTAPQRALISNFEALSITDVLANGSSFDVSKLTGVGSFTAAAGVIGGGTANVTSLGANSTVTIAGANTGTALVPGTNETATFSFASITASGGGSSTLTINGVTVSVAANLTASAADIAQAFASVNTTGNATIVAGSFQNPNYTAAATVAGLAGQTKYTGVATGNLNPDLMSTPGATGAGAPPPAPTPVIVQGTSTTPAVANGALTVALLTDTAADTVNLVLNQNYTENNDATPTVTALTSTVSASLVETLVVTSSGKASTAFLGASGNLADGVNNTLALTDTALVTLTVNGTQAFTFNTADAQTKLATINASALTAGATINASATTTSTNAAMTITGSATAANTLTGSLNADTIVGGNKADVITGGGGGDKLTGGLGNDTFVYLAGNSPIGTGTFDTITDFTANTFGAGALGAVDSRGAFGVAASSLTGDLIKIAANANATTDIIKTFVATNASDASTFLATNKGPGIVTVALDSSTGNLYIDNIGSDGVADFFIQLTGVTTINAAAILLV